MLYQFCLVSFPKQQANAAVCALALRSYATGADLRNAKIIKNPDPSALRRGTGGRSSFNGHICTVFGASGFLGRSVVNQLGKIGTQLIIPYRSNFDDEEIKSLKLAGDLGQVMFSPFYLNDYESIKKAVKYSDVVVNLIGKQFETRNFSYDDVHVKGARAIAKACREQGVERLIHISSLNVNEKPKRYFLPKPADYYPSKKRGEIAVLEEFPDATIVRPATMFGLDDKFIWSLFVKFRISRQSIPVWNNGRDIIKQPVFVTDVAKGIVKLMLDHTTKGETFQFLGPEKYFLEDIVKYGLELSHAARFGYTYHDARFDPLFFAKVVLMKYVASINWHNPKYNMDFQMLDIECSSDIPEKRIPTLEDLGVELTPIYDLMPMYITRNFLCQPAYIRPPEEFYPVPPPKPAMKGLYI